MAPTIVKAALFAGLVCLAAADNYNCNTKDAASNWSTGKQAYCCEAIGKGCGGEGPKANGMCTEIGKQWQGMGKVCGKDVVTGQCDCEKTGWLCMAMAFAPCKDECDGVRCAKGSEHKCCNKKDEFNCLTRDLEIRWTDDKKKFCCEANGRGCERNGPTAGGTCAQVDAAWETKGKHCGEVVTTDQCDCTRDKTWACIAFDLRPCACDGKRCGDSCNGCPPGDICPMVMQYCQSDGGKCGMEEPKCNKKDEFNCLTRDLEISWTDDKKKFCCEANGRGCERNGPTAGGTCAQVDAAWKTKGKHCGEVVTTGQCDCTRDKTWACIGFNVMPCACDGKRCGDSCNGCPPGDICLTVMQYCQSDGGKCGMEEPKCNKKDECSLVRCKLDSTHKCCQKRTTPEPTTKKMTMPFDPICGGALGNLCEADETCVNFECVPNLSTVAPPPSTDTVEPIICTEEMKTCKDGSRMPRGKDCTWYPEKCKDLVVGGPCTTRHGCCKGGKTAKKDADGSNCDENQPVVACAEFSGAGMYGKCRAKKASGCKWRSKDKVCYSGAAPPAVAVQSDKTDCSPYTGVGMYSKCKKHFSVCKWEPKGKTCLAKNAAPEPEKPITSGCAQFSGRGMYSKCKKQGLSCKWVAKTKTCASNNKPATTGACSDHNGKGKFKHCRAAAGCQWNNSKKECFSPA